MKKETQTTEPLNFGVSSEELYRLKLHDLIMVENDLILRVPGGWLYSSKAGTSVFVPFNNEFQPRSPVDENLPF